MRTYILLTILILAGGLSAPAFAQQNVPMRFAAMDRDGDGVITRSEWRGSDESFRMNDWNGDGVLSGNEVRPGARQPLGTSGFNDWTTARFTELDRNRDNQIARSEWTLDRNSFDLADFNRDGVVTRPEFLRAGRTVGTTGTYGFSDWTTAGFINNDRNRDNRITRGEWLFDRDSFDRADDNGDGILTRTEFLRAGQAVGTTGSTYGFNDWTDAGFINIDRNRDNRITRSEWRFDRDSFDRADYNNDGILTRTEFLRTGQVVGTTGSGQEFADWTAARFDQIDRNRDGRITRSEWQFDRGSFDRADDNQDGILTRSEFLGLAGTQSTNPVSGGRDQFDLLDLNNDASITRNEWTGTRIMFDTLDRNRDGAITRDEFTRDASPAQSNATYQLGYERGITEGRAAGREDRVRNQGWDLDGQRELEAADSGYEPRFGAIADYQAGYRAGFRFGYPEGWNSAR